jgi:hypothetical protein
MKIVAEERFSFFVNIFLNFKYPLSTKIFIHLLTWKKSFEKVIAGNSGFLLNPALEPVRPDLNLQNKENTQTPA